MSKLQRYILAEFKYMNAYNVNKPKIMGQKLMKIKYRYKKQNK